MQNAAYMSYRKKADLIDWKKMNVNDLFRECIAHKKEDDYEIYFSAIVCRFFGYAGRIYSQCNHHVPFEECYDCIIDAIRYVLEKRVWENEDSSLYGDKSGPDKAMHIAMKRQKAVMLSRLTAEKRQSNFNTLSLDNAHEDFNDSADGMLFDIDTSEDTCKHLISSYFNSNTYIEGFMLDSICYNVDTTNIYQNVVSRIKNINKDYYDYFKDAYDADLEVFKKTLHEIKHTSNRLLTIKLKKLLHELRLVYNY